MASASTSSSPGSEQTHPSDDSTPSISILQPLTYSASSCGYCSTVPGARSVAKTSKSYGAWAHALSCDLYKDLLDRGWRRSGCYLYKPDMSRTCCPQYTISLDASRFRPSRGQRQVLSRFAAFVRDGDRQGQPGWGPPLPSADHEGTAVSSPPPPPATTATAMQVDNDDNSPQPPTPPIKEDSSKVVCSSGGDGKKKKPDKGKGKGKARAWARPSPDADWTDLVHAGDWNSHVDHDDAEEEEAEPDFEHRFEYTLEPASFTEEKYDLYKKYQTQVHHEPEATVSRKGFKRFLVDTPLELEPTRSPSYSYGSHHALYRLDGRLIAFAVLDILPRAVSSVYFVWDPEYAGMSLGKVSALRETAMVKELEAAGAWEGGGGRYMMGYYIHTCPKMRYKADYQPSFLLDPPTNTYYPWSECKPRLDATPSGMATFAGPFPSSPPPQPQPSSATSVSAAPSSATDPSTAPPATTTAPPEDPSGEDLELAETANATGEQHDDDDDDDDDDDAELDTDFPSPPPPGCLDPNNLPIELLAETFVIQRRTLMPFLLSDAWRDPELQREARELLATVGEAGRKRLAIFFGR
ncbi:hypothetical protein B0A53_01954 [Rhodotorula sp. CCFEE 5036]|nr:hypothetical protein B0A53_01954 [Rhodotorula sp. CCFEE 5036]